LGKHGLGTTCSYFLKAAELIAGPYRARINAATMIAQSKISSGEIDASCELIDFYVLT
jgi:1-pyrroline-5-carboxylate dehydrogenase